MYFAPYIDTAGIHMPTYQDRLDALLSSYRSVFGQEINLDPSAPDYQLLSVFARALDDLTQAVLVDYTSHNPQYAGGLGLDLLLPLAGLSREGATYSTVLLTLSGTPGAVLPAAPEALDDAGHIWRCRTAGISLDSSGSAVVEAVCADPGAIAAPVGSVHRLVSPVTGLSSVVNQSAAAPGREAESDASCRKRLRLAAAAPAVSTLDSLRSAVLAVKGVNSCAVYENDSDTADSQGIPGHSICVVVSGGLTADLAPVIFRKKAPGIGTHGGVSYTVQDDFGVSHTVKLQRATMTPVALSIELTPLAGFDASVADRIRAALAEYSSSLGVGQDVVVPSLYSLCYGADKGSTPTFSISLLTASAMGTATAGVLQAAWNQRYMIPANMVQILIAE